jgi:hypothetical protein
VAREEQAGGDGQHRAVGVGADRERTEVGAGVRQLVAEELHQDHPDQVPDEGEFDDPDGAVPVGGGAARVGVGRQQGDRRVAVGGEVAQGDDPVVAAGGEPEQGPAEEGGHDEPGPGPPGGAGLLPPSREQARDREVDDRQRQQQVAGVQRRDAEMRPPPAAAEHERAGDHAGQGLRAGWAH